VTRWRLSHSNELNVRSWAYGVCAPLPMRQREWPRFASVELNLNSPSAMPRESRSSDSAAIIATFLDHQTLRIEPVRSPSLSMAAIGIGTVIALDQLRLRGIANSGSLSFAEILLGTR
jgi:hypothetical protein